MDGPEGYGHPGHHLRRLRGCRHRRAAPTDGEVFHCYHYSTGPPMRNMTIFNKTSLAADRNLKNRARDWFIASPKPETWPEPGFHFLTSRPILYCSRFVRVPCFFMGRIRGRAWLPGEAISVGRVCSPTAFLLVLLAGKTSLHPQHVPPFCRHIAAEWIVLSCLFHARHSLRPAAARPNAPHNGTGKTST